MIDKRVTMLILRAQSGDKESFNLLLKSLQNKLYWYIWNLLADKTLADDILQEVFVKIYRKLHTLSEPELFFPWMYKIATREIFKQIKKNKNAFEIVTDSTTLENLALSEEENDLDIYEKDKLSSMIGTVSPASKAVLMLHYGEGFSLLEVAQALEINYGTVKSRLSYGLSVLREKYSKDKVVLKNI